MDSLARKHARLSVLLSWRNRSLQFPSLVLGLALRLAPSPKRSPEVSEDGQRRLLRSLYQPLLAASSETTACWCTQRGPRITLPLWNAPFFFIPSFSRFLLLSLGLREENLYTPNKNCYKKTVIKEKSKPVKSKLVYFFFCLLFFPPIPSLCVVLWAWRDELRHATMSLHLLNVHGWPRA